MYNTSDGKMRHAKLPFAVPQVHETHPFKHKVNHDSLGS